ncbi:winged helix-turn-helix domain-containing protein [Candidatus Enterococcus murrayae]|uniref:Winged helix-turn-helix domain-containing protein n=1 Tax=Candidatus Enterococcus murrayae TaxID=2815321 RepID=A0ABS3HMK2_9ENTE|nr:helix-turn-helix domain-containing protein [Enterococcus sp. MJM16]MBO0454687.1 winged helix-turn-helix domain-containing protein [Enterococcus sp. MJM16]
MISILLLTKNILVEKELQKKLQRLNYEVFCCSNMLYLMTQQTRKLPLINYFDYVILSETISENEMQQILAVLPESKTILRKLEKEPEKQIEGIDGWISETATVEELRETLCRWEKRPVSQETILSLVGNRIGEESAIQTTGTLSLSKLERRALEKLYQANGKVISRENLCDYLWKDGATKSRLAQLSILIKKLRIAFQKDGIAGETVQTSWGEGYLLTNTALEYYEQEREQERLLS